MEEQPSKIIGKNPIKNRFNEAKKKRSSKKENMQSNNNALKKKI